MPQNYTQEFKKKIVRLHLEEESAPTKVSQLNTASQKPVSPSGAENSAKNARQARKQKKNTII